MVNNNYMRLSQWAALHGMHRMTAWRHYNAGTLPAELQPKKIGNIIYVLAHPGTPPGRIAGYARVSSAEQKPHLENQANRLWAYASQNRILMDAVVSEIASGLNDGRPKLRQLLGDPTVHTVIGRTPGASGAVWRWHGGNHAPGVRRRAGCHRRRRGARRPGGGHDRDTDLLLRPSVRQTLRRRPGPEGHGVRQWLS